MSHVPYKLENTNKLESHFGGGSAFTIASVLRRSLSSARRHAIAADAGTAAAVVVVAAVAVLVAGLLATEAGGHLLRGGDE